MYGQRLVAILFADVVGYSRLTGEDEVRTYRIVNTYFQLINEIAVAHGGRVVSFAGDSLLSEFTTATNALNCALDVIRQLSEENEKQTEQQRVQFRIGINLGEVNSDGDHIFGDTINIAARLEGLADPGGICVSESVRNAIGNKIPVDYEFLGEQYVKNIKEPVRPYRVLLEKKATTKLNQFGLGIKRKKSRRVLMGVIGALLICLVLYYKPWTSSNGVTTNDQLAESRPSIAVLPFDNLGNDANQEQFSDGLTNDIITDLSKFSGLFVIAANSTFRYKDKPTKVQDIAKELNVRYVLEGSVQRISDNLRINAQLIDAESGHHIWAEKYDREISDFFIIQNDIGRKIVEVIGPIGWAQGGLRKSELDRLAQIPTKNLSAYQHYLKGIIQYEKFNAKENKLARDQFRQAIELDPKYAQAIARLASTYIQDGWSEWSDDPERSFDLARLTALQAIEADVNEAQAYRIYGMALLFQREHDGAIRSFRKALELNPNDANNMMYLGWGLTYLGKPDEGLYIMQEALARNPFYPGWYYWDLAWGSFVSKDYESAISTLEQRDPKSNFTYLLLAASYQQAGRENDAKKAMQTFRQLEPQFSIAAVKKNEPFKYKEDLNHYLEALRSAGLPEE